MSDDLNEISPPEVAPERDPGGPLRSLDWRFARVQQLVGRPRGTVSPLSASDDIFVRTMRKFQLLYDASTPGGRQRLGEKFPGPYGAIQLRESVPAELQLAVQCRILARQTDAEIAKKVATTEESIDWYEKFFYNVRDRLDAPDWVWANVLRPGCLEIFSALEGQLKLVAYLCGPDVYEAIQNALPKLDGFEAPADLEGYLDETVIAAVRRQAVFMTLGFNKENSKVLFSLTRLLQAAAAVKRDSGATSTTEAMVAEAVRATIDAIRFVTRGAAEEYLEQTCPDLLDLDTAAAELRDSELYDVVAGNAAKFAHLKDLKMPPPGPARNDPPLPDQHDASPGST